MVVFSTLRRKLVANLNQRPNAIIGSLIARQMGGHGGPMKMKIETTSYQFMKCINLMHLYSCLAAAFFGSIVFYSNVFIGEAELREIPEGYVPKYWEYYSHPITRWIAWLQGDPQKYYENLLHHYYNCHWDMEYSALDEKVKFEIKKNKDYKAYYYTALDGTALRHMREEGIHDPERFGLDHAVGGLPLEFKDDGDLPDSKLDTSNY